MILLLMEALRHRERVPDAARDDVPVPVWLTLGSWDPRSQGLRDWVTATIGLNHPYLRAQDFGPDAIVQLFDTGRIALFLDGLDEMPDTLRGEDVERLNAEAAGRRVVITSRPREFRGTVDMGQQLPYTAVVELRPVGSRAAARYLLEGQVGVTRRAWQDVADRLLAHPGGVLARTLNTPLTLSLARSAYAGGDPRELLTQELSGEQALRGHLLDRAAPAAVRRRQAGYRSWIRSMSRPGFRRRRSCRILVQRPGRRSPLSDAGASARASISWEASDSTASVSSSRRPRAQSCQ
jgi:hypothetical protein